MSAASDTKFMFHPFLPHDLMGLEITIQQTVLVSAVDVITDAGQILLIPFGKHFLDAVFVPVIQSGTEQAAEEGLV